MKKVLLLLVLAVTLAVSLSACSPKECTPGETKYEQGYSFFTVEYVCNKDGFWEMK